MPVKVSLPTYTLSTAQTSTINVTTYYSDIYIGDILQCFINEVFQYLNGNPLPQGHLVVVGGDNFLLDTDISLESDGTLLVFAQTQDEADSYSIDSNGHLIYTTTV